MLGMGVLLLVVAGALSLVGAVMFAVAAFRVSLMWGLLVLFVPFAGLVFLVKYWDQAKRGFLVGLAGSAVGLLGFFALSAGITSKAQAQLVAISAQMKSQMPEEIAREGEAEPTSTPASDPKAVSVLEATTSPAAERSLSVRPVGNTQGFPEIPPDSSDPGEIKTGDLGRHVGEELLFVEKDGGSVWGKLVSVSSRSLRIERRLHGGSVQYDVLLTDIRSVRADG